MNATGARAGRRAHRKSCKKHRNSFRNIKALFEKISTSCDERKNPCKTTQLLQTSKEIPEYSNERLSVEVGRALALREFPSPNHGRDHTLSRSPANPATPEQRTALCDAKDPFHTLPEARVFFAARPARRHQSAACGGPRAHGFGMISRATANDCGAPLF